MAELFLPAAPGSFSLLRALVDGDIPSTWDSALYDSLGARGRLALFQSSTGCRDWVALGPQAATITLTGYGGIQDAVWERQIAGAEHRLALRGPRRGNKLVLRQPSPNQAALHSLLCIAPAAGRAVSELAVQQLDTCEPGYEGVFTPWLRALPWAFPNLTTLCIKRLAGRLPPAAMLPGLRELYIEPVERFSDDDDVWGETYDRTRRPEPLADVFRSIAPYTPQLHTLEIGYQFDWLEVSWPALLDRASTALQRLSVAADIDSEGVRLLCQYAPGLQYLGVKSFCPYVDTDTGSEGTEAGQPAASEQVTGLTWQVEELTLSERGRVRLDMLPCTTAAGLVIQRNKGPRTACYLDLTGTQVSNAKNTRANVKMRCSMLRLDPASLALTRSM